MRTSAPVALLIGAVVAAACSSGTAPPRAKAPPPDTGAPAAAAMREASEPRAESALAPVPRLVIPWPGGWKLLDQGRAGPESLPVLWYRFEAPSDEPLSVARLGLAALRAAAGTVVLEDAAGARGGRNAVAQIRGSRLSAAIDVRAGAGPAAGKADVRVTVEPAP